MTTTRTTQSTVRTADIPAIVADSKRGIVSLVGDHGGLALITGDVKDSSALFGTMSFETEHGMVYLDPEGETTISEEFPLGDGHEWRVSWTIDTHGSSPERAAARVWRDTFGRAMAGSDDACFFTVTDPDTGIPVNVDLSEFDFDSLVD